MNYLFNNFKKFWPVVAADLDNDDADDDDDDDADDDADDDDDAENEDQADQNSQPDRSSMQTLVDGTAQQLCLRLWKQYISNDVRQFPNFMMQIDEVCTNFVQSMPIPIQPDDLEDGGLPEGEYDLPVISPENE